MIQNIAVFDFILCGIFFIPSYASHLFNILACIICMKYHDHWWMHYIQWSIFSESGQDLCSINCIPWQREIYSVLKLPQIMKEVIKNWMVKKISYHSLFIYKKKILQLLMWLKEERKGEEFSCLINWKKKKSGKIRKDENRLRSSSQIDYRCSPNVVKATIRWKDA